MGNGNRKEFLNAGILGGGAGVPEKRGFRAIATDYIGSPDYNPRFFETFPTAWASAYAFQKALETEDLQDAANDNITAIATEEWVSLFLLHYFGEIHLTEYKQETLKNEYDKDLWLALSGTYPNARETDLASVRLLETDDATVVGAYYPEIIFFPSRGRATWPTDKVLQKYLIGTRISWELCSRNLLTNEQEAIDFHLHLRRVANLLPSKRFKDRLDHFCERQFGAPLPGDLGALPHDPTQWEVPGNKAPEPEEFLEKYPLRRPNKDGGHNYYLVFGMPHMSPWMTTPVQSGWPSPWQYRKGVGDEIIIQFGGKNISCPLKEGDRIIPLKELFLTDAPYWCKIPRAGDAFASRIRSLHKIELRDPALTQNDVAVCLAPVKREFLEHFPEVLRNLRAVYGTPNLQRPSVEWNFPILGKEVKWQTNPMGSTELPNTSLALWPPKVSWRWKFYVIHGFGSKESSGRWHLIDEDGSKGIPVELEEGEEYISILQSPGSNNRPRALMLSDSSDRERGILFLSELSEQGIDKENPATLSVDFGTSNTCLAYKKGESSILKFQLSPEAIWGKARGLENPGFVPFRWGGSKGFFPTLLLSRRSNERLSELRPEDIQAEHLFMVDIAGLHHEMEDRLFDGRLNTLWQHHSNMKWELDIRTPWRSLFLALSLLYAHAEVFFGEGQGAEINKYIFTFPLAFSDTDRKGFHTVAQEVIRKIRQFCYGEEPDPQSDNFKYIDVIDESTAIARSARVGAASTTMEVFIDVGGGTADIAIRHGSDFLVLDSIKVAGNTFFRFAQKNFEQELEGASDFKRHLARVLLDKQDKEIDRRSINLDLGTFYSLAINRITDDTFKKREAKVIQEGMGRSSYQAYRSRLFFRHILAYALLQACAAAVDNQITPEDGIKLILGGNAWGLMLFAEFPRSSRKLREEAQEILKLLKRQVTETLSDEERKYLDGLQVFGVELLNETNLSKAKTDVAVGALNAERDQRNGGSDPEATLPYTGLTVRELRINDFAPTTVRWRDRWGFEEFRRKLGFMDKIISARFEQPKGLRTPLDPVLSVFTCIGNSSRNDQDNMPGETWRDINAELCENIASLKGNRLKMSPINYFISKVLYPEDEQRDFLDTLAEENGSYKTERR